MIDTGLDRLHEVVADKLARYPVLAELDEEAAAGQVTELTRQQMELALAAAARKDEVFAQVVMDLVAGLRVAEQAGGRQVAAGAGSAVFTGDAHARAEGGGIAIGQVAGDVLMNRNRVDPTEPGQPG